jgi:hypothetical protein
VSAPPSQASPERRPRRRPPAPGLRLPRWLVALPFALLLIAAFVRPVGALLWSDYRVWAACPLTQDDLELALWIGSFTRGQEFVREGDVDLAGRDPWGRPYRVRVGWLLAEGLKRNDGRYVVTSRGPDGVDQEGGGDDVLLQETAFMEAIQQTPLALAAAAAALGWLLGVIVLIGLRRSRRTWVEVLRALGLASLPAALLILLLWKQDVAGSALLAPLADRLLVPLPVAASAAAAFVVVLAALWLRLRRPLARPAPPRSPAARARRRRRLAGRAALGLALAGVGVPAGLHRYTTWQTERRLALAQLGDERARSAVLQGDLPTLRRFLATPGPFFRPRELRDEADVTGIARLGPEAIPVLVASLGSDRPNLLAGNLAAQDALHRLPGGSEALYALLEAEPGRHVGPLFFAGHRALVERGRLWLLARFADLLDDTRPTEQYLGTVQHYVPRVCDVALTSLEGLQLGETFGTPNLAVRREVTQAEWDAAMAKAKAWLAARGDAPLPSAGYLELKVVGLKDLRDASVQLEARTPKRG